MYSKFETYNWIFKIIYSFFDTHMWILNTIAIISNIKCKYLNKYLVKLKYKFDYSITHVSFLKPVCIYLNMNLTIMITKCE